MASNTHARTRAQHVGKKSRWDFLRRLKLDRNKDHTSALLVILFFVLMVVVICSGGRPIAIREGYRARATHLARVDFRYINANETELARRGAMSSTPSVFIADNTLIEALKIKLAAFFKKLALNTQDISQEERQVWGLTDEQVEVLHGFLLSDGASDKLIQIVGALLDKRLQLGMMNRAGKASAISLHNPSITIQNKDGVRTSRFLYEVVVIENMGWQLRSDLSMHTDEVFLEILVSMIQNEMAPTLKFDQELTRQAKEKAASLVEDQYSPVSKGGIILESGDIATFKEIAMFEAERIEMDKTEDVAAWWCRVAGGVLVCVVIFVLLGWFIAYLDPSVFRQPETFFRFGMLCLVTIACARFFVMFRMPLTLVPLAFFSVVLGIAYRTIFSVVTTSVLALPLALVFGMDPYLIATLEVGAIVGILATRRIRKRLAPVLAGLLIGISQAIVGFALGLFSQADFVVLRMDAGWHLLNGCLVGIAVQALLPLIEKFFSVVTEQTLLELSDQNSPLLKRLILEAPGTYHHSLVVANLAEGAAEAVGGHALLTRVALYYHDIGKLLHPEYFTENEYEKGLSHGNLSPTMSTLVIISHTKDGLELARQHKIPKAISRFIPEHHGTSLVEYFYQQAVEEQGEENVKEEAFRYPGPRPQTAETGIAMLADSVEAATRALTDPTPSRLETKVHAMILKKLMDHQLEECPLTFADLRKIEQAFMRVLLGIHHKRVPYPQDLKDAGILENGERPPAPNGEKGQTGGS